MYNKSVTNLQQFDNPIRVYEKSTTIKSNDWSLSMTEIASDPVAKCPKMTKVCSRCNVPWGIATQFRRNHLRRWRKDGEDRSRILFEQIGPERLVQTGNSFGSQGHPKSLRMVPFDRRQNFLYFLFPGPYNNWFSGTMPSYCMTVLWRRRRSKVHSSLIFVLFYIA